MKLTRREFQGATRGENLNSFLPPPPHPPGKKSFPGFRKNFKFMGGGGEEPITDEDD